MTGAVDAAWLGALTLTLALSACQTTRMTGAQVAAPPSAPPPHAEGEVPSRSSPGAAVPEARPALDLARLAGEAWLAAFKARDADKLASVYTEDACVTTPGRAPVCGRTAIAEAARAVWSKLPAVKTAWGRTWRSGDFVAVESAWSTEAKGAVALALSALTPEGLIREERVYEDERAVTSQPKGRPFEGLPTSRETHEATGATSEQTGTDLLRANFSAPTFADDTELVDFTETGSFTGKKYGGRWTGARAKGLAGAHVTVTRSWGVEGYFLCEYETTGTRRDGPRGEALTIHGAEVLQIEDGKVTRAWRYTDSLELTPASNLLPVFSLAVP